MKFSLDDSILLLERTPPLLSSWLVDIPDTWIRLNVESEEWTVYDVIGHLIHGEKTDWIPRAKIILGRSENKHFVPFDREAQFKDRQNREIIELLSEFEYLREENIDILRSLRISNKELVMKGVHPEFGEVTLQELLSTWTVHDMAHIAQIARILAKHYQHEVGPWKKYLGILTIQ